MISLVSVPENIIQEKYILFPVITYIAECIKFIFLPDVNVKKINANICSKAYALNRLYWLQELFRMI